MIALTPHISGLMGLFFLVYGIVRFSRSRGTGATAITRRTHLKLGVIFCGVGLLLLILWAIRL